MKLSECSPGDIVAIAWPETDYDVMLAGTEQLVQVGSILGGRKRKGDKPHTVIVNIVERESLVADTSRMRALSPLIEVLDRVERSQRGDDDGDGVRDGLDFADPLQGRRR